MIKLVATAIWICLVTLGSVYASIVMTSAPSEDAAPADFLGGLDYVRGDVVSVPVLGDEKVKGYFLARLVFTAEPEKLKQLSIEPQMLITDALYSHLMGNEGIDFSKVESFDLVAFRNGIRDAVNERIGEKVFHDIIIEQVDYLSKDEIRSKMRGARYTLPEHEAEETAEDAAPAH